MKSNIPLMLLLMLYSSFSASEIYNCSVDGKTVFTDKPCDGSEVEIQASNIFQSIEINTFNKANDQYSSSKWHESYSDYNTALDISTKYNIPLFIYFQADWSRFCRKLERELLSIPKEKNILKTVVKVRITPENSNKDKRLFKELGGKGYPTT